jgi:DNA-binding beta-propeller fold protein YncE
LNLKSNTQQVADVTVGASPTGVAIDEGTGTALIANTGDNTVSELNLALLTGSSPATSLTALGIAIDTSPIAVAIDPDRGTNNKGLAVVTALELISGSAPIGVLDAIDLGGATPVKSTTAQVGTVTSTPTGIVFNPTVSPTLFYATSSGGNVVTTFNPDNGSTTSARVGVNPTSLAINPQTGGIITINTSSHTISILDTISNPFKTRNTFGLGGSPQFGVAIDQFTNLAVLADQANNRVLIFPVPN